LIAPEVLVFQHRQLPALLHRFIDRERPQKVRPSFVLVGFFSNC